MKSLALNSNHDIEIINGELVFVDDADEVAQAVKTRLLFFFSEWPWAVNEGVPWFEQIFIKNPDFTLVESVLKTEIIETEGVVELFSFDLDFDRRNRGLKIENLIIRSNFGLINTEISI